MKLWLRWLALTHCFLSMCARLCATGEDTEAAAQQECDEAAAYAEELSAERCLPFPCGVFGCGKRYSTREELQLSRDGKEMGCVGGEFGWCVAGPFGQSRTRRKRRWLGEDEEK